MQGQKRTAIITGGTRGIGLGIAKRLVVEHYDLMLVGQRSKQEIEPILNQLQNLNKTPISDSPNSPSTTNTPQIRVEYCRCNIAEREDRDQLLQKTLDIFGRIDILINNAGVAPQVRADLLEMSEESFDRVLSVNLKGPFFLTQAVAKQMLKQRESIPTFRGTIVNISSVSARVASINRGEYCISKAGVSMSTKLFAVRLANEGIAVYEIQPGIIESDMTSAVKEKYDKLISSGLTVEKRWGTPDDIGIAVAALVRGDIPYATGQTLILDGGLTLLRL